MRSRLEAASSFQRQSRENLFWGGRIFFEKKLDLGFAPVRTGLVNGNPADDKPKKHTMNKNTKFVQMPDYIGLDEKSWVVTTSYCQVYQIQTLAESLAEETTRLTAPMTWEQAVVAVAEYENPRNYSVSWKHGDNGDTIKSKMTRDEAMVFADTAFADWGNSGHPDYRGVSWVVSDESEMVYETPACK